MNPLSRRHFLNQTGLNLGAIALMLVPVPRLGLTSLAALVALVEETVMAMVVQGLGGENHRQLPWPRLLNYYSAAGI